MTYFTNVPVPSVPTIDLEFEEARQRVLARLDARCRAPGGPSTETVDQFVETIAALRGIAGVHGISLDG